MGQPRRRPIIASGLLVVFLLDMIRFSFLLAFALLGGAPASAQPAPAVTVGLFCGQRFSACEFSSASPLIITAENGALLTELPLGAALKASAEGDLVRLPCPRGDRRAAAYLITSSAPVEVRPQSRPARSYRGQVLVKALEGRLLLVNQVCLEEYLRGVLPCEMPPSAEPQALRAQAIAARTYALATVGRHAADGYDLCDTSHCQVYLGADEEDARCDSALEETAGLIATYEGEPIHAVYHDACGGRTAANETAWAGSRPLPYLRPVNDSDGESIWCAASPNAVWTRQIPQPRLAAALARFGVREPISAIEASACDENGRPEQFRVRSAGREVTILSGVMRTEVNRALGWDTLPSADFQAAPNGDAIVFAGRGNGHGVGLCQWGANEMAKAGYAAADILRHYYSGVTIEPLSPTVTARLALQDAP